MSHTSSGSAKRHRSSKGRGALKRPNATLASDAQRPDEEYRVGPGRPPRQYQFKPGQSGNPKGARRKTSLAPDLKALLERALNKKVKLRHGEGELIVTKAAAGIAKLVDQFAKGDRHARRDLITLADKLGVDLTAGQGKIIENAIAEVLTPGDEALLANYLQRHGVKPDPHGDHKVVRLCQSNASRMVEDTKPEEKTS
jgi:hypothetical protein